MRVLDHKDVTAAMLVAGSIAEPDPNSTAPWWGDTPGEIAWNSATAYTGTTNYVIRPTTHRVYRSLQSSTNKVPETNPLHWEDVGPTNKFAPFDMKTSTSAFTASPYLQVIDAGVFTDVDISGMKNVSTITVAIRDTETDQVFFQEEQSAFWWTGDPWLSYYFDMPMQKYRMKFRDLSVVEGAQLELRAESVDGLPMQISQIAFGRYVDLGCAEFGMEMKIRTFGSAEADAYGNATIKNGLVVVDLAGSNVVKAEDANRVAQFCLNNRNRSLIWEAVDDPIYDYLATTGVADVSIKPEGPSFARMSINIQGIGA